MCLESEIKNQIENKNQVILSIAYDFFKFYKQFYGVCY